MGSLKDLQNYFGWSYAQVRKRVLWLQEQFSSEVNGGQNRKYQVTDSGLAYLERLGRLEQGNADLSSAQKQLLEEESPQGKAKLGDKVDIEP